MIDTPDGLRAVETFRVGDLVTTFDHGPQPIRWIRSSECRPEDAEDDAKPVQIKAGALGWNLPVQNLIVSPQHRILIGGAGQLQQVFSGEGFAPAKSLTALPGIRHMKGKQDITWVHLACDQHEVIVANGCLSESFLLGPMVVSWMNEAERETLTAIFGHSETPEEALNGPPARSCMTASTAKRQLAKYLKEKRELLIKEIQKWDDDLVSDEDEAERMRKVASPAKSSERTFRPHRSRSCV